MSVAIWIAVAFSVVIASAPITTGGTRKIDDKALGRYVRKIGLPLPDALRGPVIARITHQERLTAWWGFGGLVAGVALSFLARALGQLDAMGENGDLSGFLVMLSTGVGMSIGAVIAAAGPGSTLNPTAPRLAHGTATGLADYLHRSEVIALVAGALLTLLAGGFALALSPQAPRSVLIAAVLADLVVVAVVLAVVTQVARRPQRAGSELELAWDDVMRASGLRQLLVSGLVLNVLATGVIVLVGGLDLAQVSMPVMIGLGVAGLAALVVAFVVPLPFWASRVHTYPVRRLWPAGVGQEPAC